MTVTHHDDHSTAIEPEADAPLRSSAVVIPLLSLFAVLVLVIGLAAVISGDDEEVDAATLLSSAPDAAREAGTARMTFTMTGSPMNVTGRGFVDLVNGDAIIEMDMFGQSFEMRMLDGTMYMRFPAEARPPGLDKEWIAMEVPGMDAAGSFGATANPGGFIESLRGVTGEIEELALVARARSGDVEAFERLYRLHAPRVFALCLRMSGDRVRATELVQDVFVRAWERLPSFRGDAKLSSWLHRLAVNVVLTDARTERRRTRRVALGDDEAGGTWEAVGAAAGDAGDRIDLERAIAALPPGARQVFVLHDIEGYRHGEIARITGTAEGTLRAQLHRARKLLMEMLGR